MGLKEALTINKLYMKIAVAKGDETAILVARTSMEKHQREMLAVANSDEAELKAIDERTKV